MARIETPQSRSVSYRPPLRRGSISEPVLSVGRSEKNLGMNPLVPNDHSGAPLLESNVDFRAKRAQVMSPLCIALTRRPYWFGLQ